MLSTRRRTILSTQVSGTMAVGTVTTVWWATLFSVVCLFPGSFESDGGNGKGGTGSSASGIPSVPGFSVVYTVSRYYPGRPVIACANDDPRDAFPSLLTYLVPPHLPNPTIKSRMWAQELMWNASVKGEAARGAVCRTVTAPFYQVSVPLMSRKARLVPEYLSYTISEGEDILVRLHGAQPRGEAWWQQEPLQPGGWKHSNLTKFGELFIPAAMLTGSGFYSVASEKEVNDSGMLGTFSIFIRDCPVHRYGDDCRGWCPDCLNGGVCHPRTGDCVCPEGITGRHCEVRCPKEMSGLDCSVLSLNIPGRQVCRPSPVPCRCVPGYTGPRCNISCPAGKWGQNCAQDCHLHCVGDCDRQNGECDVQGPSPCSGGDTGLPRLRRAPKVTDIGSDQVTIEFSEWKAGYDDGDAGLWDTLTYVVRLKTSNSTDRFDKDVISSGPRRTLKNLTPATMYEVQVVIMVAVSKAGGNLTCVADGTGRERVHRVFFTTFCPEEIPAPIIVRTEKTSDTSIFVRWKPVPRPQGCPVQYHLSAIPETSDETSGALEARNVTLKDTFTKVEKLEANVAYTISVLAESTTSSATSAASSTQLKIHKKRQASTVTVAAAVIFIVVMAVVIVVLAWRRIRRRPSNTTVVSIPAEEGALPPPSPPSPRDPDESACEAEATERVNNIVI